MQNDFNYTLKGLNKLNLKSNKTWIASKDIEDEEILNRMGTSEERKRHICQRLFAKVQIIEPRLARKIVAMLLEMDNEILLQLLQDEQL